MKHEHLLEGLIAAENKETDKEDAALTAMASKIFEEKRSKLRRLDDEVIRGVALFIIYPDGAGSPSH